MAKLSRTVDPQELSLRAGSMILPIRGQRVLLDFQLSALYGVETRALKQAVRRNSDRFPSDFMFELTPAEIEATVSQNVIPRRDKLGGAVPMAFTEQGVAMLSSVLRSKRAVQVNIGIMRAFVRFRELLLSHAELASELKAMEKKYDRQFKVVFDAIRQLMAAPAKNPDAPKPQIGFHVREDSPEYRVTKKRTRR
jgi:hypothetical protein